MPTGLRGQAVHQPYQLNAGYYPFIIIQTNPIHLVSCCWGDFMLLKTRNINYSTLSSPLTCSSPFSPPPLQPCVSVPTVLLVPLTPALRLPLYPKAGVPINGCACFPCLLPGVPELLSHSSASYPEFEASLYFSETLVY